MRANVSDTDYLFGGDVIIISQFLHKLAEKHIHDMPTNTEASNRKFTVNILEVVDVFLNASIAWNEINEDHVRHKCSSQLLSAIDHISYLYIISLPSNDSIHFFKYRHLQVFLTYVPKQVEESICFKFESGSVCVPPEVVSDINLDSIPSVATEVNATYIRMTGINNQTTLIGLSLANGKAVSIPRTESPIVIEFDHEERSLLEAKTVCSFWDLSTDSWSQRECFLAEEISSMNKTVCECYHLTNFGIIMDFTGGADPFDAFLNYFSTVTMVISILFILLTEILLCYLKYHLIHQI